ncbi:MAG: TetR/AcrR family transcriptional regulator [Thermodesulfobacteriota bacterium]
MARVKTLAALKERERESRRRLILEAAERVFGAKPHRQVSLREIAREAGLSPASIYRYFPDRQTLFIETFVLGAERLIERLEGAAGRPGGAGLKETAAVFLDFLTENDNYFRAMTNFMLDGGLAGRPLEKLNRMERALLDRFDRAFQAQGLTGDVRLLSHAFFAALNGVLITFRDYPGRTRAEVRRHMDRVAGVLVETFLSPPDRKPGGG